MATISGIEPGRFRVTAYRCHCGHEWVSRDLRSKETPRICPLCKNILASGRRGRGLAATSRVTAYRCRCGHEWVPRDLRSKETPRICPKCKTPNWDRPKGIRSTR